MSILNQARLRTHTVIVASGFIVFALFSSGLAHAQNIVRGANFVHPLQFSTADQDANLAHLKSAGIRVIRLGIEEDLDKNIDFMKRAYAQNIATVVIFHGKYAPNAPVRPYSPKDFRACGQGRHCPISIPIFPGSILSR